MSYFEKFPATTKPKTRSSRWDLVDAGVLLGSGLIVLGVALVYKPAAFIVGGLALVALGILLTALNGGTHE